MQISIPDVDWCGRENGCGYTFTARKLMIPVARSAMLTGKNGVSHQLIPWIALKRDGLTHIITSPNHHTIVEGFRIRTLLKFIGWKIHIDTWKTGGKKKSDLFFQRYQCSSKKEKILWAPSTNLNLDSVNFTCKPYAWNQLIAVPQQSIGIWFKANVIKAPTTFSQTCRSEIHGNATKWSMFTAGSESTRTHKHHHILSRWVKIIAFSVYFFACLSIHFEENILNKQKNHMLFISFY